MLKLKGRGNSHSRRLSEEKNESKRVNNANFVPSVNQNLDKTHQALKTPN